MIRFVSIRLLRAAITVLAVMTFAFVVLRLSGDPAAVLLGPDVPKDVVDAFRAEWHLGEPIWRQYLAYMGAILTGDFGLSMRDKSPALELVLERVPATLMLTIPALLLKIGLGIPAGIYAALHRDSAIDRGVILMAILGFTIPSFVMGLVLVLIIIALYTIIVMRSMLRLIRERDMFIRLAGTGLAAMFGVQAMINLGVAVKLLPAKGMTLPFVSYGGSSLIAGGIAVGMLLAFTRTRPQGEIDDLFRGQNR